MLNYNNINLKEDIFMILIVEDSLIIRKLIVEILSEKNIPVMEASNGEQALEIMKRQT